MEAAVIDDSFDKRKVFRTIFIIAMVLIAGVLTYQHVDFVKMREGIIQVPPIPPPEKTIYIENDWLIMNDAAIEIDRIAMVHRNAFYSNRVNFTLVSDGSMKQEHVTQEVRLNHSSHFKYLQNLLVRHQNEL